MAKIQKNIASSIRYSDDIKHPAGEFSEDKTNSVEMRLSLEALKVTEEVTPSIYAALRTVCERLGVTNQKVTAYIHASSTAQAQCISYSSESCIIILSSELVSLLSQDELEFVIGHELGHFLLRHTLELRGSESKESYLHLRAKEISVDRLGLWACKDLDAAMKAIIKTLSGLDNKLLRFDLNAFLNQIELKEINEHYQESYSTHPSLVLRAKSLLRFSLSQDYQMWVNGLNGSSLKEIDELIRADLNLYTDSHFREEIKAVKTSIKFWTMVYSMIKKGSLTKSDQELISDKFGQKKKGKLRNLLKELSPDEAIAFTKGKILESKQEFIGMAPHMADRELNLIIKNVEKETNNHDLLREIQQFSEVSRRAKASPSL